MQPYSHQQILLATQHHKEQVIKPIFEDELACKIIVTKDYDTDQFGTFSGEIPRVLSAYETCIKKAEVAMQIFSSPYAIANEGSFGPDPQIPFIPLNTEIMVFIDKKRELVIAEQLTSRQTNYAHIDLKADDCYAAFLKNALFPSHGLMVKALNTQRLIKKGIQDKQSLSQSLIEAFNESEVVRLETDMRAMMNPSRMKVIASLAKQLAQRSAQLCSQCLSPGFGLKKPYGHLNCELCHQPTSLYEKLISNCLKCDHKIYLPRPDGLTQAKASYCHYCNP